MKRCNENPLTPFDPYSIPDDIYGAIYHHLSSEAKQDFSLVDRKRLEICSSLAKSIYFSPPKDFSNDPENIYPSLFQRYPNIRKITFESSYKCGEDGSNQKQIRALIKFLNANPDKHPLEHIQAIDLQEIDWFQRLSTGLNSSSNALRVETSRELNGSLLSALGHAKLEAITWRAFRMATVVREQEIKPFLEKAVGLKHFEIEAILGKEFDLSFEKQTELISALFTPRIALGPIAIQSLSSCQNLKHLNIGYTNSEEIKKAFSKNKWNLEQLSLTAIADTTDLSFTKQMPLLTSLALSGSFFLDHSKISEIGQNCLKLKELRIQRLELTEEDFLKAFRGFSNLELLTFDEPSQLTSKVWDHIKLECPKMNFYNLQWSSPWSRRWIFSSRSCGLAT